MKSMAADLSTDKQFMDVSGISGSASATSSSGVTQTAGNAVSASAVSDIEKQLGVVAVYSLNAAGQLDTAAGYSLYNTNGTQLAAGDPRIQEFSTMTQKAGVAELGSSSSAASPSQSEGITQAVAALENAANASITYSNANAASELVAAMQETIA
jgi:hypothetical protein